MYYYKKYVLLYKIYKNNSPVQVSHLLLPITKRLHYFYANQALFVDIYIHCSTNT